VSDHDLDRQLARLAQATDGIRGRPGFVGQVMLAALATEEHTFSKDFSLSLRRLAPVAFLAAALSVGWAFFNEQSADDAFAAADETVELEW
jgi:hypothetical protein